MKTTIVITLGLALVAGSATAQLAYQSAVSGQSPDYYATFNNTYVPTVGTGTWTANNGATFGSDYWGNATGAALFPTSGTTASANDYLTGDPNFLSSDLGTSTAVGSMSLLFYVPSAIPTTGYYFSDGDATSGSYFAFAFGSGALNLKAGNSTFTPTSTQKFANGVTVTPNTWYYLALAWNLNGTATGVNGITWDIGQAGQSSLVSGFIQKGVSGGINSTSTLGIAGATSMDINAKTTGASGVAGGQIDELATWNTVLTGTQISDQFNALAVPEPSSFAFCAVAGLFLLKLHRKALRA